MASVRLYQCVVTLFTLTSSLCHVIEFNISEELPLRSFVGTVRNSPQVAELSANGVALRFSFRFATGPYLLFSLDDVTGDIRSSRRVDREQLCVTEPTCTLSLDVTVLPLKYFQIVKVIIHVNDINDHAPMFAQSRLVVEIKENTAPGTSVALSEAEDPDSGVFGVQSYQMTRSDMFKLSVQDQSDGSKDVWLVLTGRLDRERTSTYWVTVTALDGGSPVKSGSVVVEVRVGDANDNNPQFDSAAYEVEVSESEPPGSTVLRVHATDPDQGLNGALIYRLADHTLSAYGELFGVNNKTGEIFLLASLDHEKVPVYQLTVIASDLGTGSLPAYTRVTLNVLDENDNTPQILINSLTDSGRLEVLENIDPGAFVAYIAVRDLDSGKNGVTECHVGTGSTMFRLEPVSGMEYKLTSLVTFDRELVDLYGVTLTCTDKGSPPLSVSRDVQVFILDVNDNSPVFSTDLYSVNQLEGNHLGAVIVQLNATDLDIGVNARLTYTMEPVEGTPPRVLDVNPTTGTVTANVVLDFETLPEYKYRLGVCDGGTPARSGSASLVVRVVDVNDELPVFDKAAYYFTTTENRPIGSTVGTVKATDRDVSPAFNKIVYSIPQVSDSLTRPQ
jgi:protocadherin delta 1